MTPDQDTTELDPQARALLDAFRQAQAAPSGARARVWDRLEHATATAGRSALEKATAGAAVLGAVAGLLWLAWPRPHASVAWSVDEEAVTASAHAPAPVTAPAPVPAPSPAPAPAPSPSPSPEEAAAQPLPPATRARSAPAPSTPPTASPRDAAQLRDEAPAPKTGPTELELIARAKKALARGDARATLAATDEHARRFPDGVLVEERALLEIEARCALREHARVDALRQRFLAAHADSPLADRVRHSCQENRE